MMPEERCPYCNSKNISYEESRIDWENDKLVVSEHCTCDDCEEKFMIETDYAPISRNYYDYSDGNQIKKEVASNE